MEKIRILYSLEENLSRVTGTTRGIGLSMARALAYTGLNLILVDK